MTRAIVMVVVVVAACGGGNGAPDVDAVPPADADCSADRVPPGGACPAECTGGCADGVCTITCGPAGCNDGTITCPADFACNIVCTGVDACDTTTIHCPAQYACTVACDQYDACGDVMLVCGAGACAMSCLGDGGEACGGSMIQCGTGSCAATCAGSDLPAVDCASSCGCSPCP